MAHIRCAKTYHLVVDRRSVLIAVEALDIVDAEDRQANVVGLQHRLLIQHVIDITQALAGILHRQGQYACKFRSRHAGAYRAVKVTAKCDGSLAAIKIDPQAINPADAQLLEDMVLTAANQALQQAKEISNSEMGKVTAGFNLPGLT